MMAIFYFSCCVHVVSMSLYLLLNVLPDFNRKINRYMITSNTSIQTRK